MQKQEHWSKLKNIFCVRPDNLGDVIMTAPAIRALKESCPGRKITLLASKAGSPITKFIPEIDDIIEYDPFWVKNDAVNSAEEFGNITKAIKEKNFDGAVIFTVYSQNPLPAAMLCHLAGIPNIAAYCRENPYQLINTWIPDTEPLFQIKHEVIRQLDLVKSLGATTTNDKLFLTVNEKVVERVEDKLATIIDIAKPFLLVHPGVSEAKRQYPATHFAKAAKIIIEDLGYQIILTGSKAERNLTDEIQAAVGKGSYSVAGDFSLEEFITLIKIAPLLISNNTGPVHIAAAVDTPVVVLYALTNPQHTPWKVAHKVLPFDVPENMRSKNTIITYAYQKAFKNSPKTVNPLQIVDAVNSLLTAASNVERKEIVSL